MTPPEKMKRRAILLFALDRPGVLNKIALLIRKKMYNVETITACKTHQTGVSRMTLTLREDSDAKVAQVIKQIEKLTEVLTARELDIDNSYWREVAIVKFECDEILLKRLQVAHPIEILNQDRRDDAVCIAQVAGTSRTVDEFIAAVGADSIVEVARSGFTALER